VNEEAIYRAGMQSQREKEMNNGYCSGRKLSVYMVVLTQLCFQIVDEINYMFLSVLDHTMEMMQLD
jgi:hypothetical protein